MAVGTTSDDPTPGDVVRRFLDEVLGKGDLALLETLISNAALRMPVRAFRLAFPDLSITTELLIAEGDLVAAHVKARATHQRMFQGIPATGRPWAAVCTAMYRVRDGRISDAWITWDLLRILEQIGGVTRAASASA